MAAYAAAACLVESASQRASAPSSRGFVLSAFRDFRSTCRTGVCQQRGLMGRDRCEGVSIS